MPSMDLNLRILGSVSENTPSEEGLDICPVPGQVGVRTMGSKRRALPPSPAVPSETSFSNAS